MSSNNKLYTVLGLKNALQSMFLGCKLPKTCPRTYLAHHELESKFIIIIFVVNLPKCCVCPQALSNTVWGFSKLEVVHERLLDAVAAIALRKLQSFNGQNIANTVSLPARI